MIPSLDFDKDVERRLLERQRSIPSRNLPGRKLDDDKRLTFTRTGMPIDGSGETETLRVEGAAIETVIGFLFAQPDTDAMQALRDRHLYFDQRTGDAWDLFFPGYYQDKPNGARRAEDILVDTHTTRWWFSPTDFDEKRNFVEAYSEYRWEYSGKADLLLATAQIPASGEPEIDWKSLVGAQLGTELVDLDQAVEAIMQEIRKEEVVRLPVKDGSGSDIQNEIVTGTIISILSKILGSLAS